ncbi:hypothetical protein RclHR1_05780004 [Rhizophagus clarus]|uniref:Uncharacterized protein n=2 Tax=Rhizophagus clarus TaxID=94130 RepID=A0A2Z6RUU5_9GLOM|nr:hypothetical protein RclHR1_05780004 [Rhizophagus clarus]
MVPNLMSEEILCHIMTILQNKLSATNPSKHHLNILGTSNLWNIILRATGEVMKLHSNPFVKRVRESINELCRLFREKMFDMQLLQQLLEYSDEKLLQHFDKVVSKKKNIDDVLLQRFDIVVSKKKNIDDVFFYTDFCPASQKYFYQTIEKSLDSARRCCNYRKSRFFRNIFEAYIQENAAATKVEYISQRLIPDVFKKYDTVCKQFKEWEKLKISDVALFCKNFTNIDVELDLMGSYKGYKKLETVLQLFEIKRSDDDWLKKSVDILKDDSMKLNQINGFFVYLDNNLSNVNNEIAAHDIKNLINGIDDRSDEKLIQDETVSSLIQVIMNKNKIEDVTSFLILLSIVIDKNPTLGEKIILCNSCMALRNMYRSITNRREVTKEKIKDAVLKGTFTFTRDKKDDECLVSLQHPSKSNVKYSLNEILDLRGQGLSITKQINTTIINDKEAEICIIDEFVIQVDITQEIINIVSILIQMGHPNYRKFIKKLQGTDEMKVYLESLKEELTKWQDISDRAQENCYYLTFFTIRHLLSFYDYFMSENLDNKNEDECKELIKFVSSKAQLPPHKNVQGGLFQLKDHFELLCKIGKELEKILEIFRNNHIIGSIMPFEKILRELLLQDHHECYINHIRTLKEEILNDSVTFETNDNLEFPFSYYFQINYYKRYYFEELDILTNDSENIEELIEDHIEDFRNNLIFIHPRFDNLQKHLKLYYDDFVRIILSTYSIKVTTDKEKFDFILRQLIGDNYDNDPFILHIYWWKYEVKIMVQLKLVDKFPELIKKAQNDFIVYEKIKEMINLGKSAKRQEFITIEIIDLVFNNLDNNNDVIPVISFITKSLKLIPLESEVRLKIINDNIKNIDSYMAEFFCETIQPIFNKFKLDELLPNFKNSIESLMKQEDLPLQQITSIAFLKEFINKFWKNYFEKVGSLSKSLIKEINNIMKINDHPFIQSLQSYFILDLNKQSSFNTKQLEILKKEFSRFKYFTDIETNANMEMNFLPRL